MRGTHAVDNHLFLVGSGRNDHSTRTHAEGINPTAFDLGDKGIFCRRKVSPSPLTGVVLYLVYQFRRMLQTHANGNTLGLHLYATVSQIAVDITGRMTCSQDDRSEKNLMREVRGLTRLCLHTNNGVALQKQTRHLCFEMHLSTTINNGIAHCLYDARQFICSNMRMGISQNTGRGSMLAEHVEYLLRRATLLTAGVQLAVRISSCPTLSETIVAVGIHLMGFGDKRQILLAFVNILATFQHNGTQAQFNEPQGRKQTTWASPDNNNLGSIRHVWIAGLDILVFTRLLVDITAYLQIDIDGALAGIDTATENPQSGQRTDIETILIGQPRLQRLLIGCYMRLDT